MKLNNLKIIKTDWAHDAPSLTKIRHKVFVEEQQVPVELELDEHDLSADHFMALHEEKNGEESPIAAVRLLKNGHIGRMAVLEPYRNLSVGRQLLDFVIKSAQDDGLDNLFLYAQLSAIGFYEKAGFTRQGDIFMDAGIKHMQMYKKI